MKKVSALIVLFVLWGLCYEAHADVEALARFHFEQTKQADLWFEGADLWFEGFAEVRSGTQLTYRCHRADSALSRIVRATDGKDSMSWVTASVPKTWKGESANFLWTAGLGCNLGNKQFELFVNGTHRFTFRTPMDPKWTVQGQAGGSLSFVAVEADQYGDLFGYMKMTVPGFWLKPGEPLLLKITGESADSLAWVMSFEYPDALAHSQKDVYQECLMDSLGGANIKLTARPTWAGKTASIHTAQREIGSATFEVKGDLAVAALTLPRQVSGTLSILIDGKVVESFETLQFDKMRLKAFLDEELKFERFLFPPGKFPSVEWKRPGMVANEVGPFDLTVNYYDADMNPVSSAKKPGRYGAVVEGTTSAGYTIRRYVTLFCVAKDWNTWGDRMNLTAKPFEGFGISRDVWLARQQLVDESLGSFALRKISSDAEAAVFFAGLSELGTSKDIPEYKLNPSNRDRQWWVTFKRKEAGVVEKYPGLARPIKLPEAEAPVLHKGKPSSVGYSREDLATIRKICKEWAAKDEQPLATLVARKGVIVFHEAFGKREDGRAMTDQTPTWMASITKLLTGTLMMEFVDQGLVNLDDPLKKYLPEFEQEVGADLTILHLFTHTNGLWGHGTWGGDWNSSLENVIGHYLPYLEVGKKFQYNGMGYAVAGKVMEQLSGRAIPYLFQECLFKPLGARHTQIAGTSGDSYSICLDMAKVGQLLLNRGTYGNYRFFSEKTFEKMLPVKLDRLVPGLETEWGIGTAWVGTEAGLSARAFGHGGASGAILRIDPELELVIVSCRNSQGAHYGEYAQRLIEACSSPFAQQKK